MPPRKKPDDTSSTTSETAAGVPAIAVKPADQMTLDERVEQVCVWLLSGAREADVVEAIRANWPDQEVEILATAAMHEFEKSAETNPAAVRGWCFEATKHLYHQMARIGDFTGALRAVKQLLEIAGR